MQPSSSVLQTSKGLIEYIIVGRGTPVLFIHGGHSNCRETLSHKGFDRDHFQLVTPSRPGYGQSQLKGNESPREAAALIIELLDHLSLRQVVVYGISAGGLTAIELAAHYPARVEKLLLASAVTMKWLRREDSIYKTAQIMFRPGMEAFIWAMVRTFAKVFPRLIANSFYPQFSSLAKTSLGKADIEDLMQALRSYRSGKGFLNDLEQDIDPKELSKIQCPTLIVHSEHDASVSFDHADNAHALIPHSQLLTLQNEWGHLFWIGKDADKSIQSTIQFIQSEVS